MPDDLSMVTTDRLIEELKSRFDIVVGICAREMPYDHGHTYYEHIWKGPWYAIRGLWDIERDVQRKRFVEHIEDVSEDDEI